MIHSVAAALRACGLQATRLRCTLDVPLKQRRQFEFIDGADVEQLLEA